MAHNSLEELKRHKLALAIIALLVLVKFAVVPLLDWQEQKIAQIALLENKQQRISRVFDNQDNVALTNQRLQKLLEEGNNYFLPITDDASFQLEQQKWLEAKVREFGLDLNNIGWSPKLELPELNGGIYRVQVSLDGKTADLVRFMQALHSQPHSIEIREMVINFTRQNEERLGRVRVLLNLGFLARKVQ